mmetsp:Transcript_26613/g.81834  ORF Transcript_26613/g.81834 Transcript_26613/m.81834 type:complete len:284 (+) Transcript_26613:404-1255(+)
MSTRAFVAAAVIVHGIMSFAPTSITSPRTGRAQTRRHVFSGIVEEMGNVVSLEHDKEMTMWDGSVGRGTELVVDGPVASDGAYIGCSIAVNGVCLTATRLNIDGEPWFSLGLSPETLRRTNLGAVKTGDPVNLERSLAADGRNSGHYVQGHVDGTGAVRKTWTEGDSLWVEIGVADPDLLACIVPKGYVAVDGTSLTVCDVTSESFTLMLIEHTQKCVVLPLRNVGDAVNLEVDVIAKYARRSVGDFEALTKKVAALEKRLEEVAEAAGCIPFYDMREEEGDA